jgi:hypothetical protein
LPPVREISEELSESLKTFGIDNARLQAGASGSDDIPSMPHVPGLDTENWRTIRIGNRLIASRESEESSLIADIKIMARTIDMLEPFARICRALDEAKSAA